MTTPSNEQSLEGLLERVMEATGPDRELDGRIAKATDLQFGFCGDGEGSWRCGCAVGDCGAPMGLIDERKSYPSDWREDDRLPAYTASIDAALALVERCLGAESHALCHAYDLNYHCYAHAEMAFVCTLHLAVGNPAEMRDAHGQAPTLPLAILAALLTALKDAS